MTAVPGAVSAGAGPGVSPAIAVLRPRVLLLLLALVSGVAGCGRATAEAPQPAGPTPSPIAKMVCRAKAQTEIDEVVGEQATVSKPTWVEHLYSCDYRYPDGTIVLSVKEFSSKDQTTAYFDQLGKTLDKIRTISTLGQGAFMGRDGSVVVRKGWKVALVNIAALPSQFGSPSTSSSEVALAVASVILGCWEGD